MATGMHDAVDAAASLGDGVVDYLTKPFDRDRLQDAVQRALRWHRLARDSRSWREQLEAELQSGCARLAATIAASVCRTDEAIEAMFTVLTGSDERARSHGLRVAALAGAIAERMNLDAPQVTVIRRAALLHDVGKLAMPAALLHKPAPLAPEELEIVRRYPELGSTIIAEQHDMKEVAGLVRDAQERIDGCGYPSGLSGPSVSIGARIIAAANAFDTMVSARIYRDALAVGDGLQELRRGSGTQFDAAVVAALEEVVVDGAHCSQCQDLECEEETGAQYRE